MQCSRGARTRLEHRSTQPRNNGADVASACARPTVALQLTPPAPFNQTNDAQTIVHQQQPQQRRRACHLHTSHRRFWREAAAAPAAVQS